MILNLRHFNIIEISRVQPFLDGLADAFRISMAVFIDERRSLIFKLRFQFF